MYRLFWLPVRFIFLPVKPRVVFLEYLRADHCAGHQACSFHRRKGTKPWVRSREKIGSVSSIYMLLPEHSQIKIKVLQVIKQKSIIIIKKVNKKQGRGKREGSACSTVPGNTTGRKGIAARLACGLGKWARKLIEAPHPRAQGCSWRSTRAHCRAVMAL